MYNVKLIVSNCTGETVAIKKIFSAETEGEAKGKATRLALAVDAIFVRLTELQDLRRSWTRERNGEYHREKYARWVEG